MAKQILTNEVIRNSMYSSRKSFNESWIMEMPEWTSNANFMSILKQAIGEAKEYNLTIHNLVSGLKKVENGNIDLYWYEKNEEIILGASFFITHETCKVQYITKNSKYKGKPPFASDLYNAVLQDQKSSARSIQIASDDQLSDGFGIWDKLLKQSHRIAVYDEKAPAQSFCEVKTSAELRQFHQKGRDYRRYLYILSESNNFLSVKWQFDLRRFRELSGLDID